MFDKFARDFTDHHPHPGDDPVARLNHTLAVFADAADGDWAVRATTCVYGPAEVTGLTWGDLRAIADKLTAAKED